MRSLLLYIACLVGLMTWTSAAFGQESPAVQKPRADSEQPAVQKFNLLSQLGLSIDQMQQIRKLNVQRKPRIEAAQRRLRLANRSLDDAIYGSDPADVEIDVRIKEVQAAQSDLIALRSTSELAVRRILTPEQLIRFRDLRSNFEQARHQEQVKRRKAIRSMRDDARTNMLNRRRKAI
jgi:Spy/CpxP family protein refolding chaperone